RPKSPPENQARAAKSQPRPSRPGEPPAEPAPATPDYQALFKELVQRANRGERLAVDRLRAFLDRNPQLWQRAGDLNAAAERLWPELIVGQDVLKTECVQRRLRVLKDQLKGPHPTALEALLVDLVGVAWLGVQHSEIQAASPAGGSLEQAAFKLKR